MEDKLNCWLLYKPNSPLQVAQGIKLQDATTAGSLDTGNANAQKRSLKHHAPNATNLATGEKTAGGPKGAPQSDSQPIMALNWRGPMLSSAPKVKISIKGTKSRAALDMTSRTVNFFIWYRNCLFCTKLFFWGVHLLSLSQTLPNSQGSRTPPHLNWVPPGRALLLYCFPPI